MSVASDPVTPARRTRLGRSAVILAAIWVLGLLALSSIVVFENRVDATRRAQVVIADLRNEQGDVLAVAFSPALAGASDAQSREQTAFQLAAAKRTYTASLRSVSGFGNDAATTRIRRASARYFALVDRLSGLVASGEVGQGQAVLLLGRSEAPGGAYTAVTSALAEADRQFGADAARSRKVATVATTIAIVFLLLAFSVAFDYTLRARRRSHRDATTDALTGLGNRRKLFADMESGVAALDRREPLTVGMFDLDSFKQYNDTFGHPAGDALLARLGGRLAAVVGDRGSAYRIGGDEFVIVTPEDDGERTLAAAQAALSERGAGYAVGCSRGSARILSGITLEQALHVADQRLYSNKPARGARSGSEAKDALMQVLAERDGSLVLHLEHVATLAELTAAELDLAPRDVELTRLAAELHDVGKAAIPESILDKAGALDAAERLLVERHSAIGERIVDAAPTLEAIGPIVRAAHERPDGNGYPDGLLLDQIPISSRIIAVVDAFDAMTSDRPYRDALSFEQAVAELRLHTATQFDPEVVAAFVAVIEGRGELRRAA
jgi:diguanylate cyclase (GGDEF)-like protein